MVKEDINFLQEIIILESFEKIDFKVMVNTFGKMEMFIKGSGRIIWFMAMVSSIIRMDEFMKEILNLIKKMALECWHLEMVKQLRVFGI